MFKTSPTLPSAGDTYSTIRVSKFFHITPLITHPHSCL